MLLEQFGQHSKTIARILASSFPRFSRPSW
jgi:hypothetical protein